MSAKVRVGLVGTSWWADLMFLPALQSHPQTELVAICGRNRARAEEMAAKYQIASVYTDYEAMFAHGGLEAVIVATPDDTHQAITLAALQAGLHVLCEKPLALNAQQAHEMYTTAEAAGLITLVLYTYRWLPVYQYAHDLVAQGAIGRCYHAEFHYLGDYARGQDYLWRFDQRRANGVLGDLGSHVIDMARWFVGDIRQVSAQLGVRVARAGVDGAPLDPANDTAQLLVEFADGAHGLIQASAVAHLPDGSNQQRVQLYGEAGSLEISFSFGGPQAGGVIRGARSQDAEFQTYEVPAAYWGTVSPAEPFAIFTQQSVGCRLFVEAVAEKRQVSPNFYDGYKAQQVIDAALESHRTGRRVEIPSAA
jgi:predicted dehydrogenase